MTGSKDAIGGQTVRARAACLTTLLVAALVSACAPAPTPPLDLGAVAAPGVPAIADADGLAAYLASAGMVLESQGDLQYDWFAPPGRTYALGDDSIVVHAFDSAAAAGAAAATVSADGVTITRADGERVSVAWPTPPHMYRLGRLLVVYVGADPEVMHLLTRALGDQFAGPAALPGVGVE